jgi:hypothetical protein
MSNVLVMFQADSEQTEQLALAVAVGAVEAEASIRLRRLAAHGAIEVGHKGYGKLQATDLLWADTVIVGLESPTPRAEELEGLLSLLGAVDPIQFEGKRAWTFGPVGFTTGRTEAQIFVESALHVAGLAVLPMAIPTTANGDGLIDRMKEAGRLSVK